MAIISVADRRFTGPISRGLLDAAAIPAFGIATLLLWEVTVRLLNIPKILVPAPSQIAHALVAGLILYPFAANGFLYHGMFTLGEALGGFVAGALFGFALGVVLSQFRTAEELLLPFVVAFQSLPRIAIAPLILVWVGVSPTSKYIIVFLVTFFPIFVNSLAGFRETDPERLELMRGLGASRWQTFRLVQLPSALPMVFAGLDIAIVYSLIGAVVGEFLGSTVGLGQLLIQMLSIIDTAGMFAVFIVLAMFGIALTQILRLLRRRLLFWSATERITIGT